jgi:hypothetical protein
MPRKPTKEAPKIAESVTVSDSDPDSPDWATETPQFQYTLEAYFEDNIERVTVTLSEYEALKDRLAEIRGVPIIRRQARIS